MTKRIFVAEIYADDADAIKRCIAALNANHARNAKQRRYRERQAVAANIAREYFARQATQAELAQQYGKSPATINRIINGVTTAPRGKQMALPMAEEMR